MKEKYEAAEMEIIRFDADDVIVTSGPETLLVYEDYGE